MSVCERLWNGRHLDNKMLSQPAVIGERQFKHDARRGSEMLLRALFRANGYHWPEPHRIERPVFSPVAIKVKRPRIKKPFEPNPAVARIIELTANHYRLTPERILGRERTKELTVPRHVAMYLARKVEGVSFPNIGRQFGWRDHTTAMFGIGDVERLLKAGDADTIRALRSLQRRLSK